MGFYINPRGETKEAWLRREGEPIAKELAADTLDSGDKLPVCLVNNGAFSAAGICWSRGELAAFTLPDDHRVKAWFAVSRDKLAPFMPGSDRTDA